MNYFISCDWGTSSFRIRLIKSSGLVIVDRLERADLGFGRLSMSAVEKTALLQNYIEELCLRKNAPPDTPCILSGMASSSIGIKELAYGKLPLKPDASALLYEKLEENIFMISGLADTKDVMRGEEVQIMGVAQKTIMMEHAQAILPGTHSKHATIKKGIMTSFKTYLSGELFDLLRQHSILRHSLPAENEEITDLKAFREGLARAGEVLLHELFSIRAKQLLQGKSPSYNYAFLSGLLIGQEFKELLTSQPSPIILIADGALARLYRIAIETLLPDSQLNLFSTEEATILGHWQFIQKFNL